MELKRNSNHCIIFVANQPFSKVSATWSSESGQFYSTPPLCLFYGYVLRARLRDAASLLI